jgi:hypothetical protein
MTMRRSWLLAVVLTLATVVSGASALGDEEEGGAHAESVCSGDSTYGMAIMPEIGLSFEVEINTPPTTTHSPDGMRWRIELLYNDILIQARTGRTGPHGGFNTRIVMGNLEGADHLEMNAVNLTTGETCWGTLQAEF